MKKTTRRLLGALLLLAALFCFVLCATAEETPKSGSCGEALQWTLEDGTLTISGTGEMADYSHEQTPWATYAVTRIVVEEGVTSISENAFMVNFKLEQVTLPSSLRSIGKMAFWQCVSLQEAKLSEGLQSIGAQAFKACKTLQTITLPQSLESIGDEAFSACGALPQVVFGAKIKEVPTAAFSDCTSLSSVTFDDTLTAIGDNAFFRCSALQQITLPQSLKTIGRNAFAETGLTALTLPQSVTHLDDGAFSGCKGLETVALPEGLTAIGTGTFLNCAALKAVQIPDSVTSLGDGAFSLCTAMTKAVLPKTLAAVPTNCFSGCALLKDVVLPDSLTAIGTGSFSGCAALESLQIPATVTTIGSAAFSDCKALQEITLPDGLTFLGGGAFRGCVSLQSVILPAGISAVEVELFSGCSNLQHIALPQGLTAIGKDALKGTAYLADPENQTDGCVYLGSYLLQGNLDRTTCAIREGTTLIADDALTLTNQIETLVLPESLTSFGNADFSACTSLQRVTFSGTEEKWHTLTLGGRKTVETLAAAEVHCKAADGSELVLTAVPIPETASTCTVCGTYGGKKCSNCGTVIVEPKKKDMASHKWEEEENMGATCATIGTVVYVCTVCGETSTVQRLMPNVHERTETIPAKEPTCKTEGYTEGVYCYDCHKYISGHETLPKGHRYTETLRPATLEKNGKIARTCVYCQMKASTIIYRVKKISLSSTSFTYDGKSHKPSVTITDSKGNKLTKNVDYKLKYSAGRKKVGAYTVVVTFQGNYAGEKTLKFKVVPPVVKSFKAKAGTKSATLTWERNKFADMYVIYRATTKDGKFKKIATTQDLTYTATKLTSGKVYYFKVVAVRKLESGNYYSADSAIKKVTVK